MVSEIIDNQYEILSKIGSGGTSVVYKARRLTDDKIVAVKVIRDSADGKGENERQFRHEVEALSQMSHRNIRRIYGVGQWEDALYMVTEYIDGRTLKDIIAEQGALPIKTAVDYALQIAAGIEHAHRRNIIHRDIKSQNILVSKDGNVKIVDFGIARIISQTTRTMGGKDVVGSVHYISPEQARGSIVDYRTDIYSFGIVLYEMFTGKVPFEGDEAVSIAMKHVSELPDLPSELNPDLQKGLNDIIVKCIQKDPQKRYQSASRLREDLMLYVANPEGFSVARSDKLESKEKPSAETEPEAQHSVRREKDEEAEPTRLRRKSAAARAKTEEKNPARAQAVRKTVGIVAAALVSVAVIALAVVLLINALLKEPTNQGYEQKPVPDVYGMKYEAALTVLKKEKFVLFEEVAEVNADVDEGCVIRTEPAKDETVSVDTRVTVFVSAGAPQKLVPNVIGQNVEDGRNALKAAGFLVSEEYEEPGENEQASGQIIGQDVHDVMADVGSTVRITYVRKRIHLTVPNLKGCRTQEEAEQKIIEAGFNVGNVTSYPADETTQTLGVFAQSPDPVSDYANTSYLEGNAVPTISFDIHVGLGYRCTYEYETDTPASFTLVMIDPQGHESSQTFSNTSKVSYTYYRTEAHEPEMITFELWNDKEILVESVTLLTANPAG